MSEITRGNAEQYEEILDFLDFVFSKSSVPHDFQAWYPNLYEKTDESMQNLINMWEGEKIIGSILAFPRRLALPPEEITIVGIGSVAAHPRLRGQGIMTRLMEYNEKAMAESGVHMSNLGGNRRRYNHYGYENTGNSYMVTVHRWQLPKDYAKAGFSFRPFDANDRETVAAMKAIYDAKPVHYIYDENQFALRLVNSRCWAYTIHDESGALCGHIGVNEGGLAREICLADESRFADAVFDFVATVQNRLEVQLSQGQMAAARRLLDVGSSIAFRESGMWAVYRWEEVLRGFLTQKAATFDLAPGTLTVEIAEGGRFALSVSGGVASVAKTALPADISLGKLEAVRFFFSVMPKVYALGINSAAMRLVESWLPLPLTWYNSENV